ncbi:TonB-dependent receptor plug domain-containing protein [Aurantiacibacter rhizosphaerae]|uniref:TonB-dependent receptor n=1 Tax=Aurantiacibacter rhizosphaerae TaxID=2691582 RepID=A0A844XAF0_9SPHN|nr:TonB-dependent receptor plug domain-containing protein [Aurantiacibacter rhizosphaerae]MWV27441.1 TonB-dependent receptor [Aurantiacibacter rhizosphaerae]
MLLKRSRTGKLETGAALAALAIGLLSATSAMAQENVPPPADPVRTDDAEASIVVTGTRIRRDGFNEPTPATVFSAETTNDLGIVNAGDIVELIPQNTAFQSDATAGITAGADVGASFANLRGLNPDGGTRTLTLVNSRRFVPTSNGGSVDLNMIPTAMIERVETVTGGASAAYGSDAIAGVVNIILNTNLEGLRLQADYGQTFRGDGEDYHASAVYGTSFGDGRGHVVFGGEYQNVKGIGDCAAVRLWCAESWDIFSNEGDVLRDGTVTGYNTPGSSTFGEPNFVIAPNSKQAFNDSRGVVRNRGPANPAARNLRFNDDGTAIFDFDPGIYVNANTFGPRSGGDGESTYADSDIQTPQERYVGYLYAEYAFSDAIEAYTELTYSHREASNSGVTAGPRSTFFIKPDNAYLPDELVDLLDGTSFSLGKDVDSQIPAFNQVEADVFRGVLGFTGEIGSNWTWDVYYQYGKNDQHRDGRYSRVNTEFQYALDAVDEGQFLTGTPNGNVVCRETLAANPDPRSQGCAPLNLFGLDNLTQEAIDYAYRPIVQDFKYSQHVLAGVISGDLFAGFGAGPIGAAIGAEYRTEKGDVTNGDIPNFNDYAFTFGTDYGGSIDVFEAFGELNVPILADVPFAEILELNGAVRWTQNTADNANTGESKTTDAISYKLAGIWELGAGVRLRGSRSRDIRSPGFRELFNQQVPTEEGSSQGIVDNFNIPGSPGLGDDPTPILNGGSFALQPESADTTTLGVVFRPDFIPGLRLSADWYQIEVTDTVTTLPGQRIVDFCGDFDLFCDRITFASPNDITFVDARQVNLGSLDVRGFDFELAYNLPLYEVFAGSEGAVSLRLLANHQYDFQVQADPTTPVIDYAGQSGPVTNGGDFNPAPDWIYNGFLSYDDDNFNATLSVRHIPSGIYDVEKIGPQDAGYDPSLPDSINDNRVDSATYFGLAMSYQIPINAGGDRYVEVFGAIQNLFDTKPPVAPGGGGLGGSNYPTNPVYFDTFGSRFRAGVRLRY